MSEEKSEEKKLTVPDVFKVAVNCDGTISVKVAITRCGRIVDWLVLTCYPDGVAVMAEKLAMAREVAKKFGEKFGEESKKGAESKKGDET